MRIKLSLRAVDRFCRIPINYQYPLSAAIYKILSHGSPDYADWLHEQGYLSPDGKPRKLFNFSKLYIPGVKRVDRILAIPPNRLVELHISSPMLQDFIQHFVVGLFGNQNIEIRSNGVGTSFRIDSVETSTPPDFRSPQKFKCLSPIVVSGKHFYDGREHEYFLRPDDENLSEAIRKNLIHKYQLVHQKAPGNDALKFSLDPDYIRRKGGVGKTSKLITIKENRAAEATHIKAFESLFYLAGSTGLMQIAWECGIGQRNSIGFGMIDVI